MSRILLVEDNLLTARGLEYLLSREGYAVVVASTVTAAREFLTAQSFDLVLLDVTLPDGDGFTLGTALKAGEFASGQSGAKANLPVIFLTARDDEGDVVRGLELGAEDYVTKPFRNRELLLRIRNLLHRGRVEECLRVGAMSYCSARGEVRVNGELVELTTLELRILAVLMAQPGQIITRARLLDEIWDASGSVVNDNTVSVYIKRLRTKLGIGRQIATVKNLGYRLLEQDPDKTAANQKQSSDKTTASQEQSPAVTESD